MYFNFSKEDFLKTDNLLKIKEYNISAAEFYNAYLSNEEFHPSVEEVSKHLKNGNISKAIFEAILEKMEIAKDDKDLLQLNKFSKLDDLKELNVKDYISNPYFKLIKDVTFLEKDWYLLNQYYKPYEIFTYDEIIVDPKTYQEITPFGYFKDKFNYPAVVQNETIWMSLIPHEINTMKKAIEDAKGNVLIFGLGLGYYLYMVSEKSDVNKIVVVEKDPRIISLFKNNLLNRFPYKDKISIVCDDAYKYLEKTNYKFDYAFVDIYHNVLDGFPLYVRFKPYERRFKTSKFTYWIETSLIAYLRRYVLMLYEEKVHAHYSDEDYKVAKTDTDKFINKLYFYLKNYEFNSYEEFRLFLSDESLMKILINM